MTKQNKAAHRMQFRTSPALSEHAGTLDIMFEGATGTATVGTADTGGPTVTVGPVETACESSTVSVPGTTMTGGPTSTADPPRTLVTLANLETGAEVGAEIGRPNATGTAIALAAPMSRSLPS